MDSLNKLRQQVCGILQLVACGGAHEIERNEELQDFEGEVEEQEDGSMIVTIEEGTQRFRLTIELVD